MTTPITKIFEGYRQEIWNEAIELMGDKFKTFRHSKIRGDINNKVSRWFAKQRNSTPENKKTGFLITGDVHIGKTFLLFALVLHFLNKRNTVSYWKAKNLAESLINSKKQLFNGDLKEYEYKAKFFSSEVVFIDDLNITTNPEKLNLTDPQLSRLAEYLDDLFDYGTSKRVFIATNNRGDDFRRFSYHTDIKRMYDRLKANLTAITIKGVDSVK